MRQSKKQSRQTNKPATAKTVYGVNNNSILYSQNECAQNCTHRREGNSPEKSEDETELSLGRIFSMDHFTLEEPTMLTLRRHPVLLSLSPFLVCRRTRSFPQRYLDLRLSAGGVGRRAFDLVRLHCRSNLVARGASFLIEDVVRITEKILTSIVCLSFWRLPTRGAEARIPNKSWNEFVRSRYFLISETLRHFVVCVNVRPWKVMPWFRLLQMLLLI